MKHPVVRKLLFMAACVSAGWLSAFAMPPASVWPCLFIGLSALYYLYSKTASAGQAFGAGFFFAIGYFVTGLWWIGNALLVEGNQYAWVWPISVIGLPTLLALFTGTYLAVARMLAPADTVKGFLSFAFFLTFSEWARGNAFTGFPWNLYGYAWADYLAMAQSVHFIGSYGLTFLSVLWAAMTGFLFLSAMERKKKVAFALSVMFSMAVVFVLGQWRLDRHITQYDKKNGVVVVQPNIPQNMKWDPIAIQDNFIRTADLSENAVFPEGDPENIFIVWPETAISPSIYTIPANVNRMSEILTSYTKSNAYFVTGILRRLSEDEDSAFANSILFTDKTMAPIAFYDKHNLVPYGEFIPFQKWIPLKPVAAFRGFQRGPGPASVSYKNLPAFSPLICYEVIFPDAVTDKHAQRPRWMVNATNDGWYGDSAGPHQHFAQTRLRAIEEGLPIIRSANTGISGIIDSYGRVITHAEIFREAAITSYLPLPIPFKNPYWPWALQVFMPVVAIFLISRLFLARNKITYS